MLISCYISCNNWDGGGGGGGGGKVKRSPTEQKQLTYMTSSLQLTRLLGEDHGEFIPINHIIKSITSGAVQI